MTEPWYPAFKLKENPFQYFEAAQEQFRDEIFPLKMPMFETVKAYLTAEVSCLIAGPRGCGKSSLINLIEFEEPKVKRLICVTAPRSMVDLTLDLYQELEGDYEKETIDTILKIWGRGYFPRWLKKNEQQEQEVCGVCPTQCHVTDSSAEYYADFLRGIDSECRAREKILLNLFLRLFVSINIFLMDAPDNLIGGELKRFLNLMNLMLKAGNTLALMVTPNQAALLRRFDTFARFPIIEWKNPPSIFFLELFKDRIQSFTVENSEPRYPFTDEAVEELARRADYNPREFIRLCNLVLIEMWIRKVEKPYGLEELSQLSQLRDEKTPFTPEGALDEALSQFQPGTWVKVHRIQEAIKDRHSIELSTSTLGRILTKRGLPKRRNPDAEYLIPLPSDKPP